MVSRGDVKHRICSRWSSGSNAVLGRHRVTVTPQPSIIRYSHTFYIKRFVSTFDQLNGGSLMQDTIFKMI